jgi:hypothetical protein
VVWHLDEMGLGTSQNKFRECRCAAPSGRAVATTSWAQEFVESKTMSQKNSLTGRPGIAMIVDYQGLPNFGEFR